MTLGPIGIARCCRDWPVYILWQLRRCGECGQLPKIQKEEE